MNLVLLHGFCESHILWQDVQERLAKVKGLNIYNPDIPGFRNTAVGVSGIDGVASYILNDLTLRNIHEFVVTGHSMGGYIALEMLAQEPGRVKGLGLVNSTVRNDDEERRNNRYKGIKFIQKNGAERYVRELAQSMVAPYNRDNPEIWARVMEVMAGNEPEGMIRALESMAIRKDHTETLRDTAVPVFIAAGKDDSILPSSRAFEEAMLPVTCSVEVFEKAGHSLPVEVPGKLSEMIIDFLGS